MSEIMATKAYFLKLVGASICNLPIPPCPDEVNKGNLYQLAVRNAVQSILYLAVKDGKIEFPQALIKKLEHSYMAALMREASQSVEIDFIREKFSNEALDFMLLKGTHLKALYPVPEMRFMVDMDILMHEKNLPAARDIVLSRGFNLKLNSAKDIILIKEPCLTIELHKMLFVEDYFMHDYFCGVWERAEKAGNSEYKMSLNDLYVYTLAHLAEHYLTAGSCFRPMMDLYLMEKSYGEELDFEYIRKQFEILGIEKFADNIRALCKCMFDNGEYDENLTLMENYIVLGAPVKNAEAAANAATTKKSKLNVLWSTAFPSYKHMKLRYPLLVKLPILLPIFWVIRIIQYAFTKDEKLSQKRDGLKNVDAESSAVMKQIFEKSGL